MKQTQMLKGVLEGCVLSIIDNQEVYGYQLVQILRKKGFQEMVGGTVYPLLTKLERNGYISVNIRASQEGPDRKYFQTTSEGKKYLLSFKEEWNEMKNTVTKILEE